MMNQKATTAAEFAETTFAADDGYRLHCRRFRAAAPTLAVACLHGIQSHAGWYTQSCRWLADAGIETFFADRRGSGQNLQARGHCKNWRQLVADIEQYIGFVREQCPGLPVVLLAISWGGKIAVAAIKERPHLVDGLVLLAPGWFAKVSPTLREKLAIGWSFLFWPRRQIRVPLSDPALFTGNPRWQQFLRDDPLALRTASARLLMSSRLLDKVIADAPQRITVPSLLVLAGQDRIIDNDQAREFFQWFAASKKQVLEYPQAHHTLEFEPNPRPIFDDVIGWLRGLSK